MVKDKLEIIYGITINEPFLKAEKRLFPHANSNVFGGCVVEAETCDGVSVQRSPKYAEVLYCAKCRKAEKEWLKKHPLS